MTFEHDWFSNNISNWEGWLGKFKGQPNLSFLEIGCFEGRATRWLLENILTHQDTMMTVIDTFGGQPYYQSDNISISNLENRFRENVKEYLGRVVIYKGFSHEMLKKMAENSFDFIYVDGSHEAPNTLEDAVISWRLLKSGGVMVFDDYLWHRFNEPNLTPKPAIDAFLAIFEGKYKLIAQEYQVAIEKL